MRRAPIPWLAWALALPGIVPASCAWAQAQDGGVPRPAAEARVLGLEATDGLFRTPSAYVQCGGAITTFAARDRSATGGLLLGLGQRLELGIAAGDPDSASLKISGSAKYNLLPEALITPAVSVGVLDAFGTSREGRSGYVVVSKYVIPYFVQALTGQRDLALKLHGGYGGGLYQNRPFVGAELWGRQGFGGLAEVAAGRVSVGPRYYRGGVGVTLGLLEMKHVGGSVSYAVPL